MAWNPSGIDSLLVLSNSNRTVTKAGTDGFASLRSTVGATVKRYAEIFINEGSVSPFMLVGLANGSMPLTYAVGQDANGYGYYQQTGEKCTNNVLTAFGATYTNSSIIGVAYDPVSGKVWFAKSNVWQGSGDPAAGTNPAFSSLASGLFLAASLYRSTPPGHQITGRFTAADLSYSPPSGFTPWDDIPDVTVADASRMLSLF